MLETSVITWVRWLDCIHFCFVTWVCLTSLNCTPPFTEQKNCHCSLHAVSGSRFWDGVSPCISWNLSPSPAGLPGRAHREWCPHSLLPFALPVSPSLAEDLCFPQTCSTMTGNRVGCTDFSIRKWMGSDLPLSASRGCAGVRKAFLLDTTLQQETGLFITGILVQVHGPTQVVQLSLQNH